LGGQTVSVIVPGWGLFGGRNAAPHGAGPHFLFGRYATMFVGMKAAHIIGLTSLPATAQTSYSLAIEAPCAPSIARALRLVAAENPFVGLNRMRTPIIVIVLGLTMMLAPRGSHGQEVERGFWIDVGLGSGFDRGDADPQVVPIPHVRAGGTLSEQVRLGGELMF
jgi:hypothetical protein